MVQEVFRAYENYGNSQPAIHRPFSNLNPTMGHGIRIFSFKPSATAAGDRHQVRMNVAPFLVWHRAMDRAASGPPSTGNRTEPGTFREWIHYVDVAVIALLKSGIDIL
jgi:hypothetical protein